MKQVAIHSAISVLEHIENEVLKGGKTLEELHADFKNDNDQPGPGRRGDMIPLDFTPEFFLLARIHTPKKYTTKYIEL